MNKAVSYRLTMVVIFICLSFLLLWYVADISKSSPTDTNLIETPPSSQETIDLYKEIPTATTKL